MNETQKNRMLIHLLKEEMEQHQVILSNPNNIEIIETAQQHIEKIQFARSFIEAFPYREIEEDW